MLLFCTDSCFDSISQRRLSSLTGRCSSFDGVVLITGKRRCSEKHILETWSELNFRILNGIGAFTAGRQLFGSIVGFGMSVFV